MIVLLGLAGSGKGTQGKILSEIFGWKWLSVGEAIRQTGKYKEMTDAGELIPDEDVVKLMGERIQKAEEEGFDVVLDGYPRDETQARYLTETMPAKIDGVIVIDVPKEELFRRLALRGRDDDKERSSIERRFMVFDNNITPMINLFKGKNIPVEYVNGVGSVEEVAGRLVAVAKEMNPDAREQENDVNNEGTEQSYGE
jgi:adenylate kinase